MFSKIVLILALTLSPMLSAKTTHSVVKNWPLLPEGVTLGQTTAVAVDSHNHVFVFHRAGRQWVTPFPDQPIAQNTVMMFDGATGKLKNAWGAGLFIMPHGLSVDADDNVWVTDVGLHQVFKLSHEGTVLLNLGEAGIAGNAAGIAAGNDKQHFARPTDIAFGQDGSVYISDGYLNTRVVKFTAKGKNSYKFERQWGIAGSGPGQLDLPHSIAVSHNRVYVADRNNARVQIFDLQGQFINQWQGKHIGRPYGIAVSDYDEVYLVDGSETQGERRSRVVRLNVQGTVIESFFSGNADYDKNLGHDLALGNDSSLYVVDVLTFKVAKFISRHRMLPVKGGADNF